MARIEFWYEFASTYSYPAAMRVEEVAAQRGVRVDWRPFLLGPIFRELGWSTSPFNLQPAKGRYMWRDLERTCSLLGLDFNKPTPFPQNGLLAARVATALTDMGQRSRFSRAVYLAEFAEGAEISDVDTIATVLQSLGIEPQETLAQASAQEVKDALKDCTAQAAEHGIFGAPTWRTLDGELFWGNDRLEDALDWAVSNGGDQGSS